MSESLQFVIITGMSGAGKTVAMQSFEDLGFFVVDNMPPELLPKFLELVNESGKVSKVALVMDLRSRAFYDEIAQMVTWLEEATKIEPQILFLDATDQALVKRYKETRRSHPLAMDGRIMDGIRAERQLLNQVRERAQIVIDTSNLQPRELRKQIISRFRSNESIGFHVEVMSFGFKYGLPIDADIVMDVRFLPNPYYDPKMRNLTGLDQSVSDYVMSQPATESFYQHLYALIKSTLPGYQKEGKNNLTIAIGCTGGQHRSVAIAQRLGTQIASNNYAVNITHRDIEKHLQN